MIYLTKEEVLLFHQLIIEQSGGSHGIRDEGLLESALHQPRQSFGGVELYGTLTQKAAALGYSLINNHAFVDGNKRIGYAAVENFLLRNGHDIQAHVDDQETTVLKVAAGEMSREEFESWLQRHIVTSSHHD